MKHTSINRNRQGMALVLAMIAISTLGLLGLAVLSAIRTDVRIAANHRDAVDAFYQAEAGVQHLFAQMACDARSGGLTLDTTAKSVNYSAPSGFAVEPVTSIDPFARPDTYRFEVVGRAEQAVSRLEVVFNRADNIWPYAVFGHTVATVSKNSQINGYNSCNPSGTTTGTTHIVSNLALELSEYAHIDGNVDQGGSNEGGSLVLISPVDADVPVYEKVLPSATLKYDATVTTSGVLGHPVGQVSRDPLGMIGGDLAARIASIRSSNDNGNAAAISSNRLRLQDEVSRTLPAGQYYLVEFTVDDESSLSISGPVEIVLEGAFNVTKDSFVNGSGNSQDLRFFCTNKAPGAPSSANIVFSDHVKIKGLVYAPWADVDINQYAQVYGWVWSDRARVRDYSTVWFDTCPTADTFTSTLTMESWRQLR